MSETYDVDIGVIYTHEDEFTRRLLPSLAASSRGVAARLVLVDNVSERGVEQWQPLFQPQLVLRNASRRGYGPNLNRILEASAARYVLLLNTDTYFDPDERTVAKMVRFMDGHPQCGVAGCRLYRADGSYCFPARRFLTLRAIAARRVDLFGRLLPGEIDDLLYAEEDPHSVFACDWLAGCFLMVRREAWEVVGGFDPAFEKYFEDVDFCARMRAGGWDVLFNGRTYGYHLEQRDSTRLFSRDAWLHLQSYGRWLRKWGWDPGRRVERSRRAA